ncbi:MAG: Mur ligase family protein, partial [Pseudomonadota bacterium]
LAWVLESAGLDPGFMIGGIARNFDQNYKNGSGQYFVIEGDEYDTAFFDKQPKFLHYTPSRAIITSIEFDHADIYNDLEHVKKAFSDFIRLMPKSALLVGCKDYAALNGVAQDAASCRFTSYGTSEGSEWRLRDIVCGPEWTCFSAVSAGDVIGNFKTRLMGEHNALNALAVIVVASDIGLSYETIYKGLETFGGVKRRQEIRGEKRGVTVIDDFAHHPRAVYETISAVSSCYPDRRMIAVFEPRSNSSRRNTFQQEYSKAFDKADIVCIRDPPLLEKIPVNERFSSERLVNDLIARGVAAYHFKNADEIIAFLVANARSGDLALIMSSGGFENIHERLLDAL